MIKNMHISCKFIANNLAVSDICINTHTHTHTHTRSCLFSSVNSLTSGRFAEGCTSPIFYPIVILNAVKNLYTPTLCIQMPCSVQNDIFF